jgi:DNA-binding MarR family transcriptional regulator
VTTERHQTEERVHDLAERFNRHLRDVVLLLRRAGAGLPLTTQQISVLGSLEHGARRMSELASEHGVRLPTMTVHVNRLEREGLVTRHADAADARRVLVRLTRLGRMRLGKARETRTRFLAERLSALPEADLAAVDAALTALAKVVADEPARPDGPGHGPSEPR